MIKKIKNIYSSEFFKYSGALLSSNVLAQIIGFVLYPVITRLYNPDIFGVFNLFLNIVGILVLLTTAKYNIAIVLPKSEKKAVALVQLSLLLTVCVSFIFFIIVNLFGKNIAAFFHQERLAPLLPYVPLYLLLFGFWQTLNYYFVRQKRYYNLSFYNITQSVVSSGMKCFWGFNGFLTFGLLWGQLLGQFLATLTAVISGRSFLKHIKRWDKKEIVNVAKVYSNFPKYQLPHGLLNALAGNLPILLLSFFFEMKDIGLFSLALVVGLTPVMLFGNSVYQVMIRRMSEKIQNQTKLSNDCFLFCKTCVIFLLPFFILFAFIPNDVFGFLFGQHWQGVGFFLKLLLPFLFLSILVASLSFIPQIFSKQRISVRIEFIYIVLKAIALLLGAYFQSFNLAIVIHSVIVTIMLSVKLIWYFRIIKKYEQSLETIV